MCHYRVCRGGKRKKKMQITVMLRKIQDFCTDAGISSVFSQPGVSQLNGRVYLSESVKN